MDRKCIKCGELFYVKRLHGTLNVACDTCMKKVFEEVMTNT